MMTSPLSRGGGPSHGHAPSSFWPPRAVGRLLAMTPPLDVVLVDFSANDMRARAERVEPVARALACLPSRPGVLWLEVAPA